MSKVQRLLAADMWVGLSFAPTQERYDTFLRRARPAFAGLIEGTLLHDTAIVPTEDYLSLTAIVDVLGDRAVIELLESGFLRFVRIKGGLAYVGGGGGVVDINFPFKGDGSDPTAMGADIPEAVRWALAGLKVRPDDKVAELAINGSSEIEIPKLREQIRSSTHSDFQQLPFGRGKDPSRLPGVTPKTVRILGGQEVEVGDDIGVVLALATANLELHLMSLTEARDSATSTPLGHALRAREIRAGKPQEAFGVLRELTAVPDIAEEVLKKQLGLASLLELGRSKAGAEFRAWFHENCAGDPANTAKAYVELLSRVPKTQTTTSKIIRFLITTALGLIPGIGGVLGAVASAADSFAVDAFAERGNPKFFVERLKQLDDTSPKSGGA